MTSHDELAKMALVNVYEDALTCYQMGLSAPELSPRESSHLAVYLENQEKRKGALAVLVTLLLKKVASPEQDIRLHRTEFDGGFSGRSLDTRVVTPFLRSMDFPHMSESGWLTRSFEQSHPYDSDYPGNIRPKKLKDSFLDLVSVAERHGSEKARALLLLLFVGLIQARDKNKNLHLARPVNLSIAELVERLKLHHEVRTVGAARLPVLAMHAILTVLARETDRYRNCTLLSLEAHTTADSRSRLIGDINILDSGGALFEGYEIKHNVRITKDLIRASIEKLQTTPVQVFYILTTYPHASYAEFQPEIDLVAKSHGCQLIINGVDRTLQYYLRIIGDTRAFVDAYVTHLESDSAINYQLKESWNQLAAKD